MQGTLETASRWSSISGLADGIQVGVESGFATDLGASNAAEVALLEQAVFDAFGAWESPALQFDLLFDAGAVPGLEIDLFAVPATHPVFSGTGFFGIAFVDDFFDAARPLTNGQAFPGFAISHADIFINQDLTQQVAALFNFTQAESLAAAQRLIMHELGHALGAGHPNSNNPFGAQTNYDTDLDPFNSMVLDPADPFADLLVSPITDDSAIMSNRPCGEPFVGPCSALFFTSLQNDDIGARDSLYPAPEPTSLLLLAVGLAALARVRP